MKYIKYILLSFLFMFPCNVFALDFVCSYKGESDTVNLYMSGDLNTMSEYPISFSISYNNGNKKKTYPANYIGYYKDEFYYIPGAYYSNGNLKAYACPKEIYIAFDQNNVIIDQSVVNYSTNQNEGVAVVFFSSKGLMIDKDTKKVTTAEAVLFDAKDIDNYPITKEQYNTKTFQLDTNNSSPPAQEEPNETENDFVYCYYKNSCGAVLELKFYKNGNIHERLFNNGNRLDSNWTSPKCPQSITNYKGSASGCTGISTQNCYDYYKSSETKLANEITNGTCQEEGDSIAVYLAYNNSKASKIRIKDLSGTVYKDNIVIQISNMSEFTKELSDNDHFKYPKYIVETNEGFSFSNTKVSGAKALYMESGQLNKIVLGGDKAIIETCEDLFGKSFLTFLNENVFKIIYIAVPIILIVLTTIDFAKVVFVDDKEGMKKAGKKFGQRALVAVLIYLVPTILIFISNLIGVDQVENCARDIKKLVEATETSS